MSTRNNAYLEEKIPVDAYLLFAIECVDLYFLAALSDKPMRVAAYCLLVVDEKIRIHPGKYESTLLAVLSDKHVRGHVFPYYIK